MKQEFKKVHKEAFKVISEKEGEFNKTYSYDRDDRVASIDYELTNPDEMEEETMKFIFEDSYLYDAMMSKGVDLDKHLDWDKYEVMEYDDRIDWFQKLLNKEK